MPPKKHAIIFFLLTTQVLLCLVCAIFYLALVDVFSFGHLEPFVLAIFILFSFSFLVASFISHTYNNFYSRALYTISAVWLGFLYYFFFSSVIYFLGQLAILSFNLPFNSTFLGQGLFLIALSLTLYGFINAQYLQLTRFHLALPHIPDFWIGKKAVFISDPHLGQVRGKKFAQRIVDRINAINPDIVFIGGDLFDGVKVHAGDIISPFQQLHPALGTYYITGNHEYMSHESAEYIADIKNLGIHVLKDEVVNVDGLQIIGVDYRDSAQGEKYDELLQNLYFDHSKPSILLKHTPFHIEIAEKHGINFQISGHTHHGQMFPGSLLTKKLFKGFDYGLKTFKRMVVYTSSGVGTWGPPMRVGTKSEIVLIDFTH
jgi:predicted MPP superfamily phosphohydrolase